MRASRLLLVCATLGSVVPARAQSTEPPRRDDYVFVFDPQLGMEAGVRSFESLMRVVYRYEEALPVVVNLDEGALGEKLLGILGRAAKLTLIDWPIASLGTTAIHEVFGHGARGREFGIQPAPAFALPFPYCELLTRGDAQTCTAFSGVDESSGLRDRDLLVTLGGLESNYLTAWWLNARLTRAGGWVQHSDLLTYGASKLVYADTFFDPDLKSARAHDPWDDVGDYVTLLQDRFNRVSAPERAAIAGRLQTAYLWNLADPTLVYVAYGTLVESLYHGRRSSRLFVPSVGGTHFYPVPRFNLSPFGAEHYLDVFVSRGGALLDVYGRIGSSGLASYTGGGARWLGLSLPNGLGLGGELDGWRQPESLPDERAVYTRRDVYGCNAGVFSQLAVVDGLGLTGKLAYKTSGYLMGQPIHAGPYGYVGVTLRP